MFITFEGPEGSGKTTQVRRLEASLRARGVPVVLTREPGGTPIGEMVRRIILSPEHAEMSAIAEFLLFSASRAQLVEQFVRPHLAAGDLVLCDRFADSSLAYQGYARGLDLSALRAVTQFATGGLQPDRTFYFDIDVQAGLQRKQRADQQLDRLDGQALEFHQKVRRGYLDMAAQSPARWVVIDASAGPDDVQAELWRHMTALLASRGQPSL